MNTHTHTHTHTLTHTHTHTQVFQCVPTAPCDGSSGTLTVDHISGSALDPGVYRGNVPLRCGARPVY